MNEFFTQLKKEALAIKLSHDEKQAMRFALHDAMKDTLATTRAAAPARAVPGSYVWFSFISSPRFALPVAVVLILGLGSGTAFAARGALPGDALYAIKVNVTEPALGALAVGTEAKAQWNAQVAQTRLEEAESLAASGKLDATSSAQLAQNFDEHSDEAQTLAQQAEEQDPGSGAELAARFSSTLEAHAAILSQIGDESTSSKQYTDEVSAHVRLHSAQTLALATSDLESDNSSQSKKGADTIRVSTFAATAPLEGTSSATSTEDITQSFTAPAPQTSETSVSLKLQKAAASALSDAKDAFGPAQKSLDASTTLKVQAELTRISATVDAATSTESLTGALKDATVLKAFLKASKNFNHNFFNNSNNNDQAWGGSQSSGGRGSDKNGKGDNFFATTSATTTLTASVSTITEASSSSDMQFNSQASSSNTGSSSDNENKSKEGDDSYIRHLLNNF